MSSTIVADALGATLVGGWAAAHGGSADAVTAALLMADIGVGAAVVDRSGLCSAPVDPLGEARAVVAGPVLVQVDEVVDVSLPAREAAKNVAAGGRGWNHNTAKRLLRLALSDGVRAFPALEARPCPGLDASLIPGCKLLLRNVEFRHGTALLTPDTAQPLGGHVEALCQLDAAHWQQALLGVVGKPYLSAVPQQAVPQQALPAPPAPAQTPTPPATPPPAPQLPPAAPQPPQAPPQPPQAPPQAPAPALHYLADVLGQRVASGPVTVRAYIADLNGALEYQNQEGVYRLSVIIDDGTARLACDLPHAIIQDKIGAEPAELVRCQAAGHARFGELTSRFQGWLEDGVARRFTVALAPPRPPTIDAVAEFTTAAAAPLAAQAQTLLAGAQRSRDPGAQRLVAMAVQRMSMAQ
eukprot:TRINITY_DN2116_c0_g2_i1.p1 TRINITY_DN2116_c0_g2~~TRINITY_DN2116_c0_g2_i1.p1  ORF type:complete len:411 (+),score=98.18 TRINITY_DN2116_c0_g2_i1:64-1296(+)